MFAYTLTDYSGLFSKTIVALTKLAVSGLFSFSHRMVICENGPVLFTLLFKKNEALMPFLRRNEIGWNERFRRCVYFFLRDELDGLLISEGLIKSYKAFKDSGEEYPFVEMRELKPRARIVGQECAKHSHFILIFNEGTIPSNAKIHIRFFDSNKVTKENLFNLAIYDLKELFNQKMRFFEDTAFPLLLKDLLKSDYAVMIQQDPTIKTRYRYGLTHFHVRIDWPVAQAAEDLGKYLRYVSKELYEKGEKTAELIQQKLYEYYGFHHSVGGRRTAALVAARFLARFDFIPTVYICSSESRTLYRLAEQGISKYVLIKLSSEEIRDLAAEVRMDQKDFVNSYLIDRTNDHGVGILLVTYDYNEHSIPPADGKLRELNADYQWLNVDLQLLVPPPSKGDVRPIHLSRVYT
ncbi:MAG: hypothetical protein NTY51_03700 [Deltaproteobacteria bacterium]|nr:hypothetical protein [Deltaproteobacteria bacterium]